MVWTLVRANASFTRPSRRLVFTAVRLRCPTATLRLGFGCAANYAGYIKATVKLLIVLYILANIKITQTFCLRLDFRVGPVVIICVKWWVEWQ